jgi:hypothetical protein
MKVYPKPQWLCCWIWRNEDVISAEVLLQIPFSSYLIHSFNNSFSWWHTVTLGKQYTKASIVNGLNAILHPITLSYRNDDEKIRIHLTSTTGSEFIFKFSNHLAKIQFWRHKFNYQSVNGVLQPQFRTNFDVDKYIVMVIDTNAPFNVSSNSMLNKSNFGKFRSVVVTLH